VFFHCVVCAFTCVLRFTLGSHPINTVPFGRPRGRPGGGLALTVRGGGGGGGAHFPRSGAASRRVHSKGGRRKGRGRRQVPDVGGTDPSPRGGRRDVRAASAAAKEAATIAATAAAYSCASAGARPLPERLQSASADWGGGGEGKRGGGEEGDGGGGGGGGGGGKLAGIRRGAEAAAKGGKAWRGGGEGARGRPTCVKSDAEAATERRVARQGGGGGTPAPAEGVPATPVSSPRTGCLPRAAWPTRGRGADESVGA